MGQARHAGRTVGRYEIVKHLASGGMAEVLLARVKGIEGFERYVVVKQIQGDRSRDEAMVTMFLDEARLAASLHHASIVQVHDIGQEDGEYFIAMEYIHGESLHALLRKLAVQRGRLPLEHILTIVSAVASALHYAHEQKGPDRAPLGLVHRDVSPSNILVGYDGNVKVVDFGIAKAAHRSTETRSGMLKGKISYLAPEQCMGKEADRRSDVFALGIVLYELTTVRRLFKAASDFLTMSKIVAGSVPAPSLYRPDLPAELEAIMLKALALDPQRRYQTAEELRVAIDQLAQRLGLRTSTTALGDYMVELFGRRPEPWLVDDRELSDVLQGLDFDGSDDGVAEASHGVDDLPAAAAAQPGSLLDHAWRATLGGGAGPHASPPPGWSGEGAQGTPSGTPMGWMPAPPPAPSRRRWWIGGAAIVVPAVVATIVIATRTPAGLDAAPREAIEQAPAVKPAAPAAPGVREPDNAVAPGVREADSAVAPGVREADSAAAPGAREADSAVAPGVGEADSAAAPGARSAGPGGRRAEPAPAPPAPAGASASTTAAPDGHAAPRSSSGTKPARKVRGKAGKADRPASAPGATTDPAQDKPDTWDPDALFLKAPQ